MTAVTAYIGLGSNLEDPTLQLEKAVIGLERLPRSRLLEVSGFYRSAAMGPANQPDYLNAAAALQTELSPLSLLDQLQAIEAAQGRVRGERWGARTLDLDLLLYGDQTFQHPRLQVPHPGLTLRPFVLIPLAELVGEALPIPGKGRLGRWLAAMDSGLGAGAVLERMP